MSNFRQLPDPHLPKQGQESVWNYPRPPALDKSHLLVEVFFGGVQIAKSQSSLRVLETSHPPTFYIPPDDIDAQFFSQTEASSFCEWKGIASYWDLSRCDGSDRRLRAGWSYPQPSQHFSGIGGWISLYPRSVDRCTLEGEVVKPQPGHFYGGWITSWTIGPFKGDPHHPELV